MRQGPSNKGLPTGNPIANVLVIIVGALVIGVSIVLGFFAFVVLSGIVLIMAAVIGIRLWWFNRKLQRTNADATGAPGAGPAGGVIEGEYVIVEKDDD